MNDSIPSEVDVAFEILLEEIEEVVNSHIKENAVALEGRDFATARKMMDRAELITNFRQKVDAIRREWRALEVLPCRPKAKARPAAQKTTVNRLERGVRTPEDAFYRPILNALVSLGGSASVPEVLNNVNEQMRDSLRDVDYQTLPSDPDEQRWRNTAKWARNSLVQDGRLKSGSQYGVWEISDKGRAWLATDALS